MKFPKILSVFCNYSVRLQSLCLTNPSIARAGKSKPLPKTLEVPWLRSFSAVARVFANGGRRDQEDGGSLLKQEGLHESRPCPSGRTE